MRILFVVHSFVPYTRAGTEIYSYKLAKELARDNEVFVFFRIKDPKLAEYSLVRANYEGLKTFAINNTLKNCRSFEETYNNKAIDEKFRTVLSEVKPDVVHIHHLLFLSHGIVKQIKVKAIPIVYSLHDYWLICYRGQLIKKDLSLCFERSLFKCRDCLKVIMGIRGNVLHLYSILRRLFPPFCLNFFKKIYLIFPKRQSPFELEKWHRSSIEVCRGVDFFIAPSRFIKERFVASGVPEGKIIYSQNGVDAEELKYPSRRSSKVFRFGYMGTLLPTKGVDTLIRAFKELAGREIELYIYGAPFAYADFEHYPRKLEKLVKDDPRIKLKGGYKHSETGDILSGIDVLVVPSLWLENAPLVIQEAFISKTPVIASRIGGIPELVEDGVNGILFSPGNTEDLKIKMQFAIDNPGMLDKFKENTREVKDIKDNAVEIGRVYEELIERYRDAEPICNSAGL